MGKLWNYTFLIAGLMVFFTAAGLTTNVGVILGQLGLTNPSTVGGIQNTPLYSQALVYLGIIATVGGLAIGFITKTSPFEYVKAGLAVGVFCFFIGDLTLIATYLNAGESWIGWLGFLIMAPILVGFIHALIDWVGGHD